MIVLAFALFFAVNASASSLDVDRRTVRAGSTLIVTLVLEGEIAKIDSIDLPTTNLFLGEPSLATEFSWVNGTTTRRKIFRWTATASNSGSASVGPLTLRTDDGDVARFAAIPVTVTEAPPAPANEREAIGRLDSEEPVVVVAELDHPTALVGEQRVVSWWVYTRSAIRSVRVSARPTFADFWIEEIPLDAEAEPERSSTGYGVSRYLVRRTAIYPVSSGTLTIPPLGVTAAVMEPVESPFDRFGLNRRIVESRAESQGLKIVITEPPAGISIVGNVRMTCSAPVVSGSGPLFFDVTLAGDANLRAAQPPIAQATIDGRIDWSSLGSQSSPSGQRVDMKRTWRAAIYPSHSGAFTIPRMVMKFFKPGSGTQELACEAVTVQAKAASVTVPAKQASENRPIGQRALPWRWIAGITGAVAAAVFLSILLVRNARKKKAAISNMVNDLHDSDPRVMRQKIEAALALRGMSRSSLLPEASELAEDYRSLEAAIDMRTRETWRRDELDAQVSEQLARFVISLREVPRA